MKFKLKTLPFTLAPKNKILTGIYKSNKIGIRSIWRKLQNSNESYQGKINVENKLNKCRKFPCSRTWQYCQDGSYSSNVNQNPTSFSMDIETLILKFTQRCKTQNSQLNIEREEQNWKIDITQLQGLL